jgi:hypothetical protein
MRENIQKFKDIFKGLERAHGVTYVDKKGNGEKIKGKSFVKRDPVTDELWLFHLQGKEPSLGIIPINDDNKCIWGCIDIDSYAGFDHPKLINKIKLLNLPLVVCRSCLFVPFYCCFISNVFVGNKTTIKRNK